MSFGLRKDKKWFFLFLSAVLHLLFLLLLIYLEPLTASKYVPSTSFDKHAMKVHYMGKYRRILSKPKKLAAPSKPKLSKVAKKEEAKASKKKITAPKKWKQKIKKEVKKKPVIAKTIKKKKKAAKKLAKAKKKRIRIKPKKKPAVIPERKLKKVEIAYKKLLEQKKEKKRIKLKKVKRATRKERRKITSRKILEQTVKKVDQRRLVKASIIKEKKKLVKKIDRTKKKIIKKKLSEPLKKPKLLAHKRVPKSTIQLKRRAEKLKEKKRTELKSTFRKAEVRKKEEAIPKITIRQVVKAPKAQKSIPAKALAKAEKKKFVKKIDRTEKKIIKKKLREPLKKPKVLAHKRVPKSTIQMKSRAEKLKKKKRTELKSTFRKAEVRKKEEAIPKTTIRQIVKVPKAQKSAPAKPRPEKPKKTEEQREIALHKSAIPLFIKSQESKKLMVVPKTQELLKRSMEVPEIKQEGADFDAHAPPKLAAGVKELYKSLEPIKLEEKFKTTETEPIQPESEKGLEQSAQTAAKKVVEKKRELALAKAEKLSLQVKTKEKKKDYQTAKSLKERKLELAEGEIELTQLESQESQPELGAASSKQTLYQTIRPKFPLGPEEKYKITETTHSEVDKILEQSAQTVIEKEIEQKGELTLAKAEKLSLQVKTKEKEKDYQTAKSLKERKFELAEGEIELTQLESQESQPELEATSSKVEVDASTTGGSINELMEKVQLEQDEQYYEKLVDKSILDWLEDEVQESQEEKNFALEEEESVIRKPKFTPIETEKVEIASLSKVHKATPISLKDLTASKAGKAGIKRGTGEGAYITVNLPFSNMTQTPWFKLTGHVVSLSTDKLYLTLNGVSQVVPVVHNAFAVQLDLSKGVNKISLLALSNINNMTAKRDVQILYSVPINLPTIHLSLPIDGTQGLKEGDTIIVEGTVDDPTIKRAVLFFNKRPHRIRVTSGRFQKKVYMTAGRIATVRVMALTKKRVKIYSKMHTVLSGYDTDDMMNPRPY